jgi:hypothetical protein
MEWLAQKVRLENLQSTRDYLLRFTELMDVIPQGPIKSVNLFRPGGSIVLKQRETTSLLILAETFWRIEQAAKDFEPL